MAKSRRPDFPGPLPAGARMLTTQLPGDEPGQVTPWHLALKPGAHVQYTAFGGKIVNRKVENKPAQSPDGVWRVALIGETFPHQLDQLRPFKKPSKYKNVRTEYPVDSGEWYDSKAEAARAAELAAAKAAGLVRLVLRQPTFRLGCAENVYRPDFLVVDHVGDCWCEDVKGTETPKFRRDKKLWARVGDVPLRVITKGKVVETITPKGGA